MIKIDKTINEIKSHRRIISIIAALSILIFVSSVVFMIWLNLWFGIKCMLTALLLVAVQYVWSKSLNAVCSDIITNYKDLTDDEKESIMPKFMRR